jgi:hypothetical protein
MGKVYKAHDTVIGMTLEVSDADVGSAERRSGRRRTTFIGVVGV